MSHATAPYNSLLDDVRPPLGYATVMSGKFDTMSICCARAKARAAFFSLALAAVLSGCSLPTGPQSQINTSSPSAALLQQAEVQGYNKGFAAGELAQALRDKARQQPQPAPGQPTPAASAASATPATASPQTLLPATPDISSPPGANYNSSGPAKPLQGSAEPF